MLVDGSELVFNHFVMVLPYYFLELGFKFIFYYELNHGATESTVPYDVALRREASWSTSKVQGADPAVFERQLLHADAVSGVWEGLPLCREASCSTSMSIQLLQPDAVSAF